MGGMPGYGKPAPKGGAPGAGGIPSSGCGSMGGSDGMWGGGNGTVPGRLYGWNRSALEEEEVEVAVDSEDEDADGLDRLTLLEEVEVLLLLLEEEELGGEADAAALAAAWACRAARALLPPAVLVRRAESDEASDAATDAAVWVLRCAIRSSLLENLRPQKEAPAIQLQTWPSEGGEGLLPRRLAEAETEAVVLGVCGGTRPGSPGKPSGGG